MQLDYQMHTRIEITNGKWSITDLRVELTITIPQVFHLVLSIPFWLSLHYYLHYYYYHVLLYFMYSVLYYFTTCYNPATGCYMMIINNYQLVRICDNRNLRSCPALSSTDCLPTNAVIRIVVWPYMAMFLRGAWRVRGPPCDFRSLTMSKYLHQYDIHQPLLNTM